MDGFDEAVSRHHDAVSKQLEYVEAENARLRAREKEWQAAAGGLEEPGMLALAVNHQTAMLENSQDRERTALRERDEARALSADRGTEALEAIAACDAEKAARERAEADCAALREALKDGMGAALIERLRAAEHKSILAETMLKILGLREQENVVNAAVSIRDRVSAAVAVVEAARKLCLTDEETVYALSGAITAYDALGAEGEAVETHTHNDPDANGCRPCDRADAVRACPKTPHGKHVTSAEVDDSKRCIHCGEAV